MKPLPDLADAEKMALRGRRSTLQSARNDAAEELRNVFVKAQQCEIYVLPELSKDLRAIATRFEDLARLHAAIT